MGRPGIGYARLLVARNTSNRSTIPDYLSVITLGHTLNVPLMHRLSELVDGLEPHGHIPVLGHRACTVRHVQPVPGRVYPGGAVGGYQEGSIPGTDPGPDPGPDP